MFCTLGSEIPSAFAIWEPVLPDSTSFLTDALVSSVMIERLRRLEPGALGALPFAPLRDEPPAADLRAFKNSLSDEKPYLSCSEASSFFRRFAMDFSSATIFALVTSNSLICFVTIWKTKSLSFCVIASIIQLIFSSLYHPICSGRRGIYSTALMRDIG